MLLLIDMISGTHALSRSNFGAHLGSCCLQRYKDQRVLIRQKGRSDMTLLLSLRTTVTKIFLLYE